MVNSWSFSKAGDFSTCKKMFWLKHDQRIPEPERPLPPGKTEHANDRGTRIHDSCEHFVNGTSDDLATEAAKHFEWRLIWMRHLFKLGMVSLEGEWGMDVNWGIAEWKKAWLRLKLDAMVHHSETEATVIDYKSGRKFGNEAKHMEQLILYSLVAFLRYPKLDRVTAELWYIDQDDTTSQTFTRAQGLRFMKNWNDKGQKITTCADFPAAPSMWNCRWCPYGTREGGTGHCTQGIWK